jgi:CRP-like cAMP-binding protein
MTPSNDLTEFISNVPLFENLSRKELETVSAYMDRQFLKSGEVLFDQWDKAECVYFIESGALEVLTKKGPDEHKVVATLRRGRSIGEMCLIDNFPRPAAVRSKSETAVAVFTQSDFQRLMSDHLDLGIKILKGLARLMAQNLRKTSSRLADNMLPMG